MSLTAQPRRRNRRGMSLVEVMVVIAIIVTLMGIVGLGALTWFGNAQVETTKLQMHEVNKRIEMYVVKSGSPPSSGDGLRAAFGGDEVPKDSWNHDFMYTSPGPNGLKYDLVSLGSDGAAGGTGNAADIKWSEIKK